jgi:putative membrane protein
VIVKQRFSPLKVVGYIWAPLLYAVLAAAAAVALRALGGDSVAVPFLPIGTLGAAVAIFVAFRNNASYARWWEARTLWGNLQSSSRVFARQLVAATHNAVAAGTAESEDAAVAYRREQVLRVAALAHATRLRLRGEDDMSPLRPLLAEQEHRTVAQAVNPPNLLLQTLAIRVKDGVRAGLLGQFDPISLEPALSAINAAIASCERIKDTPTPRQYDYFTRLSVAAFSTLLPFGLLGLVPAGRDWLVVLLSALVAGVFIVLEVVGKVVEAPFAGATTDVPLTYLSVEIERDLREQLGDADLPARVVPVDGYLW